ncbi:MAG: geranylgeranyl reductase family protein [Aphanocapsa feldmannii 277cV]|uniref:Geranylgeranyl reductase family protein n=2 Tax=Aphanocapsa feldmannii TaxID=192050 RepID=A0A524RL35_9CHRO|nr:MAG: geranylgeranyl reductase family protein [Aphanocapsa feldmannii 277cV]TGH27546.1 MAG: geranylgeranyl reductase family protein [Aphanocapsa feldmannii 277cI]
MGLDVAVVGAGAAGSSAAYHLARNGFRVALLDAERLPRAKACGGGVAASAERWFPCGLVDVVDCVITRVRFTLDLVDPVEALLPGDAPFWIVRRSRLDHYLAEQAAAAGADLQQGRRVDGLLPEGDGWRLSTSQGDLLCRRLVIAAGSCSNLARLAGIGPERPRLAHALAVEAEGLDADPKTAHFEFGLVRSGFCWCFPREGGMSMGIGSFLGRREADYDPVLKRLLHHFGADPRHVVCRPWPLRVWDGHRPLHRGAALAVGDAASLCDPFLAEGLRPALLSGLRAAEALERDLHGGGKAALAGYSQAMRREWGDSMAWGARIAQVFYRFPRLGYQLGIKRPTAPRRIAQILSGELGYGDIAQRVIQRLGGGLLRGRVSSGGSSGSAHDTVD